MNVITGVTRGGQSWTPAFVIKLDQGKCIGCGRCFKVCPRDVFNLIDRDEIEDADDLEDFDDDGFSDDTSMVMSLSNAMDCVGCQACSKVCPKKCLQHQPQTLAA